MVCIPGPGVPSKDGEHVRDEARVLCVAMTRATNELIMTYDVPSTLMEKLEKAMGVLGYRLKIRYGRRENDNEVNGLSAGSLSVLLGLVSHTTWLTKSLTSPNPFGLPRSVMNSIPIAGASLAGWGT
jgi:hypothetical protein